MSHCRCERSYEALALNPEAFKQDAQLSWKENSMSAGNRDNSVDSNPDCTHPEVKANDSAGTYEEDSSRVGTVVDTRGQAAAAAAGASEDEALRVGTKVDTRLGSGAGGNQTVSSGEMRDGT